MATSSHVEHAEQNVVDSDGTLIISHGKLTGGSEYTRRMAMHHGRPWLHIDLKSTIGFQAARRTRSWIKSARIEILNVAGPRASKDSEIYQDTADILEIAFYIILSISVYLLLSLSPSVPGQGWRILIFPELWIKPLPDSCLICHCGIRQRWPK